jgi:hypothetical protein
MVNLFNYSPIEINPFVWLASWIFIIGSFFFYLYWIFLWAAINGGVTIRAWGINFAIGVAQDIFLVQVFKIYLLNVATIGSMRSQLRSIYRVLLCAALRLCDEDKESCNFSQLEPDLEEVRVVQHVSGACRVARKRCVASLFASRVLRSLDDVDMKRCREQHSYLGSFLFVLILIPSILSLVQSDGIYMDVVFPAISSAFLIANSFLYV